MLIEPGTILGANINAHRHGWNGSICSQPSGWNCGAAEDFKSNHCDRGLPDCFHMDVFRAEHPLFWLVEPTIIEAVTEHPRLLDDQILAFFNRRFNPQRGIPLGQTQLTFYGVYRIKSARVEAQGRLRALAIEPHADAWAPLPQPLGLVHNKSVPGLLYFKQIRLKILREAVESSIDSLSQTTNSGANQDEQLRRLEHFRNHLDDWASEAFKRLEGIELASANSAFKIPAASSGYPAGTGGNLLGQMAEKFGRLDIHIPTPLQPTQEASSPAQPSPSTVAEQPAIEAVDAAKTPQPDGMEPTSTELTAVDMSDPADNEETTASSTVADEQTHISAADTTAVSIEAVQDSVTIAPAELIPERSARENLSKAFGNGVVDMLTIAFATKPLVILTGRPGAGKSWLATRLIEDEDGSRSLIVPVSSTWRGREDLFGYINPLDGIFQPTPFTSFLLDTDDAWRRGDRRNRLVIFEEFNLSQPEHWFSDVLVRMEFEVERVRERTIDFSAKAISGRLEGATAVTLWPNVRFVATLNNDHTVKPLTPRVLDRSALIEIQSNGADAFTRIGLPVEPEVADLVDDLNDILEPTGAGFSLRSAQSLKRIIDTVGQEDLRVTQALDLLLLQEVLSRVRLASGDPRDERLLERLLEWSRSPSAAELIQTAGRIANWKETLEAGRDVFQA